MSGPQDKLMQALDEYVDEKLGELQEFDASEINGLDKAIENFLQDYKFDIEVSNILSLKEEMDDWFSHVTIDSESIDGLDDAIDAVVDEKVDFAIEAFKASLIQDPEMQAILLSALWAGLREKFKNPFRKFYHLLQDWNWKFRKGIKKLWSRRFFSRKKQDPLFDAEGKMLKAEQNIPDPEPSPEIKRLLGL